MSEIKLETPEEFPFPFTPYQIQEDFMKELYKALENKLCGIFESPTGTGKSLAIICGSIKWLKDYNTMKKDHLRNRISELQQEISNLQSDTTDWLTSQSKEIEITRNLQQLKLENTKIEEYYQKLEDLKKNKRKVLKHFSLFNKENKNTTKCDETLRDEQNEEEDDLLLDDLVEIRNEDDIEEEIDEKYTPTKIFICSRTHSQLTQLVGEIRKSPFSDDIRVISLASRQNYCINPAVNYYKNNSLINEKCLDLQKNKKPTKTDEDGKITKRKRTENPHKKCKYFKQEAIEDLRDTIILNVMDVEDLLSTAKDFNACPYYASRKAVNDAEVVLVPYNTILHKSTRDANGIQLKDNIVIIDEAHNLLDALGQMYGATVTLGQLHQAHQQLKGYKTKYSKRFSSSNLLCINQLLTVVTALKNVFGFSSNLGCFSGTKIFTVNDFVSMAEIDHFNMFNLVEFVKNSKLSQKLHGFTLRQSMEPEQPKPKIETSEESYKKFQQSIDEELKKTVLIPKNLSKLSKNTNKKPSTQLISETKSTKTELKPSQTQSANPLLSIISFLETLQNSETDGRILIHKNDGENKLQYLLLNPSSHFTSIVQQARAVIVAGGTMKPMSEFRDRLFINSGVDPSRVVTFSCDHIVPPESILPLILTDDNFIFNYENRFRMKEQIRLVLTNACDNVKGGIVVFFSSYKYESWVWDQVKDVNFGRPVFREPQESGSVDKVLEDYSKAIFKSSKKKAMLFSVVGGKLSEGLNFSDDLGRCVIVFGLPYANINSPDLKEKMSYLDKVEGFGAGKKFYENLCMKAVNQCIGRAVRHINDYASVLLVDVRYNRPATKAALPDWIKRSLKTCKQTEATSLITEFFDNRK